MIPEQLKERILEALDQGLVDAIKEHMKNFYLQKSGSEEKSFAPHYIKGLHVITAVYETSKETTTEFLENYK